MEMKMEISESVFKPIVEGDGVAKVDVKNLAVYYAKFRALADINLSVHEKRITAIIGPSGCGKSTLLRSFNRMNDLTPGCRVQGEISLDGEDIYAPGVDVVDIRRRVGMVFQRPNPFPKSIYDNVAYGPRLYGIRRKADLDEIVEKSIHQAALWDEVKDKLHQSGLSLSGGQQQRLCIARALAVEPEVDLNGRTRLGARPDLHPAHRRVDAGTQKRLHHHHCYPQYAAGRACLGLHCHDDDR